MFCMIWLLYWFLVGFFEKICEYMSLFLFVKATYSTWLGLYTVLCFLKIHQTFSNQWVSCFLEVCQVVVIWCSTWLCRYTIFYPYGPQRYCDRHSLSIICQNEMSFSWWPNGLRRLLSGVIHEHTMVRTCTGVLSSKPLGAWLVCEPFVKPLNNCIINQLDIIYLQRLSVGLSMHTFHQHNIQLIQYVENDSMPPNYAPRCSTLF